MNTGSISRQIPRLISKKDFKGKKWASWLLKEDDHCKPRFMCSDPSHMWSLSVHVVSFPRISLARCPPLDETAMPRMQSHTRIMFPRAHPGPDRTSASSKRGCSDSSSAMHRKKHSLWRLRIIGFYCQRNLGFTPAHVPMEEATGPWNRMTDVGQDHPIPYRMLSTPSPPSKCQRDTSPITVTLKFCFKCLLRAQHCMLLKSTEF